MSAPDTGSTTSSQQATEASPTLWQRAWWLATGRDAEGPAPAPPVMTLLTIVSIAGFLAAWRGVIAVFSDVWARLGVVEPWPEEIDRLSYLRYSVRWDSGWYLTIARDGYHHVVGEQSSIAFFPLFPFSIRLFDQILPGSDVLAGLVVVHIALLAALIYMYKLVQLDYPEIVAWRAIFFMLIFPGAFFFSALYTESLLLLGFVGTLYHARRGQWLLAGLFGLFTGLTKLIGIVLIAPVILELVRQRAISREDPWPVLYSALVPAGAIGYLASIQLRYGDFREYFEAQSHWYRETFSPEPFLLLVRVLRGVQLDEHPYPANVTAIHDIFVVTDVGFLLLFLAAGCYLWLRVRPSYGALVIAGAMVPALSGTPLALTRYMAILFPVFILLATIKSEVIRTLLAIISSLGLVFVTFLFVNGFWAG